MVPGVAAAACELPSRLRRHQLLPELIEALAQTGWQVLRDAAQVSADESNVAEITRPPAFHGMPRAPDAKGRATTDSQGHVCCSHQTKPGSDWSQLRRPTAMAMRASTSPTHGMRADFPASESRNYCR